MPRWLPLALLIACTGSEPASPQVPLGEDAPAVSGDLATWKARHARVGDTPEGVVKLWLDAAITLCPDEATRDPCHEVIGYLTLPYRGDPDWATRPSARTLVERLHEAPHIFRSYAAGATPANGYALDTDDWSLAGLEVGERRDDRGLRVNLTSNGADSPRPVYVKQSEQTGLWYVSVPANLYLDVRPVSSGETFR